MKSTSGFRIAVFIFCAFLLFLAVFELITRPQELVSAESLEVVRRGRKITVYDRLGGSEYHFIAHRERHGTAGRAAITAVQTPTIRIEIIPGGSMLIESDGKVYQITPKRGGVQNG